MNTCIQAGGFFPYPDLDPERGDTTLPGTGPELLQSYQNLRDQFFDSLRNKAERRLPDRDDWEAIAQMLKEDLNGRSLVPKEELRNSVTFPDAWFTDDQVCY